VIIHALSDGHEHSSWRENVASPLGFDPLFPIVASPLAWCWILPISSAPAIARWAIGSTNFYPARVGATVLDITTQRPSHAAWTAPEEP
jgi:hypothetical protein